MANEYSNEGSSTSHVSGVESAATVELNIKTLDSQIYSFQVDKNMPVSVFKEKIANEIGVSVGQQRLIFRGRVLKDERLLSDYQVENGHTLHLVERQPAQPQPSADTSSGVTTGSNGNDASTGAPRNRIGSISHNVLLGPFNVGDQGEGIAADLSRFIGAVLNSIGVGGQPSINGLGGMQPSTTPNVTGQVSQGSETGGSRENNGGQSHSGNQTQPGQASSGQPFQSLPQFVQMPMTAAVPVPSLHSPIPDSLNTISEFITRMERSLAQNGTQPTTSSTSTEDLPRVELPSNARGLPTPEALSIVLRHAERLLSGPSTTALSHIAGRLEQEGASTDLAIREQIQTESVHVGLAMQHLGALLLELGRSILTLRMGRSPAESSVNAGPAAYISPSGPNPIMVQPFPLQTNSLFGASGLPSNPMAFGPVGIGNAPRNVSIHIHAGTSLASVIPTIGARTMNPGMQGENGNTAGLSGSGSEQVRPVRNVIAATVPSRSTDVTVSNAAQPGVGFSVSMPPSDSMSLTSVVDQINSQLRQLAGNRQGGNQPASGSVGSAAATIPSPSLGVTVSNAVQPGPAVSVSQPPSDSMSLASLMDGINSQLSQLAGNMQGGNQPASGVVGSDVSNNARNEQLNSLAVNGAWDSGASLPEVMSEKESQKAQAENVPVQDEAKETPLSSKGTLSSSVECSNGETSLKSEDSSQGASSSSSKVDILEGAKSVPLGLGLGSLERKRPIKQPKSFVKSDDSGITNTHLNQNPNGAMSGRLLLQSLASRSSGERRSGASDTPSGQGPPFVGQVTEGRQPRDLNSDAQSDAADDVSQVLHSPVMNNLLAGVSAQTGIGSPDVFRNMLQQLSQSPQIMNTVNQIAQQVDSRDLGNMFSGLGSGQGGGINLANMVREMMPVVSQVLGRGSATHPSPTPGPEAHMQGNERGLSGAGKPNDHNIQTNLQDVAQRIEQFDTRGDVFHAVLDNVVRLNGNGSNAEDIAQELSDNEFLASEYIEMLQRDLRRRLEGESEQDKC